MNQSLTHSMAKSGLIRDGHDKDKIIDKTEIEKCAIDLINPHILKYFQFQSNQLDGPINYHHNFQDRIDRLRVYLENGPLKFAEIGTRVLVDWNRVQPKDPDDEDLPLRIIALLRDPADSTTNATELIQNPHYTQNYYLQEFVETRFSFEKVGDEIKLPKPYTTQALKTNRRYNHNPINSSIISYNEPSHLEGNPGYKRYGETFIFDYNNRKAKKLSLNIRDLKSHLNYEPEGQDIFKEFVNDSNAWVQGRCMMPVNDKMLIFLNDTRNKKQIWATILTLKDGNDYSIDYEPKPIHFQEHIIQIKNLQDLSIIDKDKIMIIVQATCSNVNLAKVTGKDYYFPLYLKMNIVQTAKCYLTLEPFTCTLPDSVNNYKEQGNRRVQIKIPRGYGSDVMIDAFPYLTFGIVNACVYGFNKFAYYWTLTDKKTLWYRFCKMGYNPKSSKYELTPSDVVDMQFPSKYIYDHSDETKSLYKQNFLKTTLDGETVNSSSDRLPCIKFQAEEESNFLFLQYPYNQTDINKIDLKDGDIQCSQGNVTVVVDKSKRRYGIYLNDHEKGFIICHSRQVASCIYGVNLRPDGTMEMVQEVSKEKYQKGMPDDKDESKSLYYCLSVCKGLDFDKAEQYFFKIPDENNSWKPKLAQTQCKQIMGQTLTATDKNILDLENSENRSTVGVYILQMEVADRDKRYYFFTNFGQVYQVDIEPSNKSCTHSKILDLNRRTHKILMSPTKKFAILQHHPWMGPWYTPSKNENFLVRFDGQNTEQVQINTQSQVFDESFPVFQKFDDWHKFGCYFSKVPNNDVIYVYNHGYIYEVNLSDVNSLQNIGRKFMKKDGAAAQESGSNFSQSDDGKSGDTYEGEITYLEHFNKTIDEVKYSKAMYLSHIGKVEDFVDQHGNIRKIWIAILYLEKEMWLFDLSNENFQTNFVCIRGYDMEYQQQRVSIVNNGDGKTLLMSDDRFMIDVSQTAMFKQAEQDHDFYQSIYTIEVLNLRDTSHSVLTKYLTYDEQYFIKGIIAVQELQQQLSKEDDSLMFPVQKVQALPPLNIFAFLSDMTTSTKLQDWNDALNQVTNVNLLLHPQRFFDRENVYHHVIHKQDFMEALNDCVVQSENLRIMQNQKGISPLDVLIATEDVAGLEEALHLVQEKQVNQVTKDLLQGRVQDIMMLGIDLRDFFQSKLLIEELRLDFLPSQSNKFTQVMYVDKAFIEKTCTFDEDNEIIFQGDVFSQSGLYDLSADLSDQKQKSVNYEQVTIPEVINRPFLEALLEIDNIKYYDNDFLKYFKEAEWSKHYDDFQKDKKFHYLVGFFMLINIYFINVYDSTQGSGYNTRCDNSNFCYDISDGRQNIWLIGVKVVILIIFMITIMEEFKQMLGVGLARYLKMHENIFDIGMIVFYLLSLYNDTEPVCEQWCIIYYQPTLIFIFFVLIRHLRLESKLAFILEMLIMTIFEMTWFLFTFWLLLVLFMFLFFVNGVSIDNSLGVGYENMGIFAVFLVTVQEALGNFGTVQPYIYADTDSSGNTTMTLMDQLLSYEFNAFWLVMVFIMLIIYTNFLIASVSDTYENVTESQDSTFSKIQLQQLVTKMIIEENEKQDAYEVKKNMIVKSCETHHENVDQWAGYVSEIKKIVTEEVNQIQKEQILFAKLTAKNNHNYLRYMAQTAAVFNQKMTENSKELQKIVQQVQE